MAGTADGGAVPQEATVAAAAREKKAAAAAAVRELKAAAEVTSEEAERTLRQADAAMSVVLSQAPYYSAIALHFRPSVTRAVPTVAVNLSLNLYLNPDFWNSIGEPERAGVLVHEILHVIREHPERGGIVNLPKWLIATDLEINDDIIADRWILTPDAIFPSMWDLESGQIAEWYYGRLPEVKMITAAALGGAEGCWDGSDDGLGPSWSEMETARDMVAASALSVGDAPEWLRRWAAERVEPQVNWRAALAGILHRRRAEVVGGKSDYPYRRPSRRSIALGALKGGAYLPAMMEPRVSVAVVVDTSGSVSDEDLAVAMAEVSGITAAVSNETHVFSCDAAATYLGAIQSPAQTAGLQLVGGGGTDMGVGIEAAEKVSPDVIVVITDGYTPWPDEPPSCPVVVTLTDDYGSAGVPHWAHATVTVDV